MKKNQDTSLYKSTASNIFALMSEMTHVDQHGNVTMVNVSAKPITRRRAVAEARISLPEFVWAKLIDNELQLAKGPVFATAIIAGIMAAKKTGDLIPLCHPLGLDAVNLSVVISGDEAIITCIAEIDSKTGVEMEALTGASIAALTVYDMCKALSHDIVIREIKLIEKTGGKNDFKRTT